MDCPQATCGHFYVKGKDVSKGNLLPVAYIGQADAWHDHIYGTGLYFSKGQTRMVEHLTAKKLLKHIDLFAEGEVKGAEKKETADLIQKAEKTLQEEQNQVSELFDVYTTLDQMDKASLQKFIKDNFNQDVDGRSSELNLREKAKQLIDQFGLPQ